MKTRALLSLALVLTVASACEERAEREEGPEDEAAEVAGAAMAAGRIELPVDLLPRAGVTVEAAVGTALARVPGGELAAGELEEEDGTLIFSFDIRVPGRDGIEEVHVDALTGKVLSQEHEDAAAEAAEGGRG